MNKDKKKGGNIRRMGTAADHSPWMARFADRAAAAGAEVGQFNSVGHALGFLKRLCQEAGINSLAVSPDVICQDRLAGELSVLNHMIIEDYHRAEAGLVRADYGVAETGTLVHLDCSDGEKNVWTLPQTCFCLLERSRIVPGLEAIASQLSRHLALGRIPPPHISLVTGPSRTADIECRLTIGVHGPSRLVILIVKEDTA